MTATDYKNIESFLEMNNKVFTLYHYIKILKSFFIKSKEKINVLLCTEDVYWSIKKKEWYKELNKKPSDEFYVCIFKDKGEIIDKDECIIMKYKPADQSINFKIKKV